MAEITDVNQRAQDNERDETADDTISRLFEERNRNVPEGRAPSAQTKETTEEKKEVRVLQDDQKGDPKDENVKADNKKPNTSSSDTSDKDPEFDALRAESDKLQKELESTKKWGHTNSRKLKKAILTTKEFVENGDISEEEGQRLLEILESSGSSSQDEDADFIDDKQASPFSKIFRVANTELENIRKYTGDNQLEDKVKAFDYFLSVASVQEQEEILAGPPHEKNG